MKRPNYRMFKLVLVFALVTAEAYAQDWQAPRTEYGHPDLQGIWSNATQTRLERDTALGEQRSFTEAEALAREVLSQKREIQADQASDPDRAHPSDGNTAAGYNSFWLDRGNGIVRIIFFFNDTATTEIYTNLNTLSLHDALPI